MHFIADLHIHSRYAYACSKTLSIPELTKWAMLKGITVMATGDFTHPQWFKELQRDLVPTGNGLFRPTDEILAQAQQAVPRSCRSEVFFMLESEVSTIYSKDEKVRKIHHLLYAPSFEVVATINEQLGAVGNLSSDGRPILGMDSEELIKLVTQTGENTYLVPAHAWTPHFAVFGSNSGFDSLEACYGAYTDRIFAIETGLSSDAAMNRLWSALDNVALISGSDSHSAPRIGREANIFDTEISYDGIWNAVKQQDREKFVGTIEFYPHEGRYHYDGHRACDISLHPDESKKLNFLCPRCGKKLTLGVLHRVMALADRETPLNPETNTSLIPLNELIAEVEQKGVGTKTVDTKYFDLLTKLSPELHILLNEKSDAIAEAGSQLLAAAVEKTRSGDVAITPGYDGLYGEVHVFTKEEREAFDKKTDPQPRLI